ncbi:Ribosome production factor 2 [Neolecta irregularis DAH-3]|uniref:Ribosome production factor 2 homolog n=1 Tax=Neolecta irregularis (strain DAH-3) TaxID=1198029 RepID=A0A1U7LV44_NEOID|nr:Ribosome production factor 2 [Neolecta irregularis DAH-3]|eukprot:OLL26488.1 Ribosome production factor 2 [Neolecta irregularis DAH-3]
MLRTIKPKNARSKRVLDAREPKLKENAKKAIFVRGSSTSNDVTQALTDLYSLKKPAAVNFTKRNMIRPFEDGSSLEFFAQKNDASLIVFGSHSKKRPNNLTWARMFDYHVLDMIELLMVKFTSLKNFKTPKTAVGMRPVMLFCGPIFEAHPTFRHIRSLFLDFFRGQDASLIDVAGLQQMIVISADEAVDGQPIPRVHFRVYSISTCKSGHKLPRVELVEMGPRIDFQVGRVQEAAEDILKEAMRRPKQLEMKKKKNVDVDSIGDKIARVHTGKQDLSKLQTRKMKGLKRKDESDEDEDGKDVKRVKMA